MNSNYPPNCPKCGGASIAPTRAGMSGTPYLCTACDHRFGGFFIPSSNDQIAREIAREMLGESIRGHQALVNGHRLSDPQSAIKRLEDLDRNHPD